MSPEDLKKFLRKNPEKNKILYSEMPPKKVEKRPDGWPPDRPEVEEVRRPDEEAEIYYTVSFSKITVDAAREKQEKVLYDKKAKLFEECYSYRRYEELTEKYPLDELFFSAEQSLFNMCKTIEDYTQFVRYFPNSTLIREAQIQIARIREEQKRKEMIKKDSLAYQFALSESTIESFEVFLQNRNTNVFKDSAYLQIKDLAEKITQQDIEWKWTSGEVQSALNFIYYRIDYSDSITDAPWLVDNLSFYAMTKGSEDDKTKAISYLGKIAKHLDGREDYLNLYLEKGFLLWASGKTDLAVSNFDLRIGEAYDDGTSVKSMLKTKYKAYQKEGVVFPEAKPTWKRIKKLK